MKRFTLFLLLLAAVVGVRAEFVAPTVGHTYHIWNVAQTTHAIYEASDHNLMTRDLSHLPGGLWTVETYNTTTGEAQLRNAVTGRYLQGGATEAAQVATSATAISVYLKGTDSYNICASSDGTISLNDYAQGPNVKGYKNDDDGSRWKFEEVTTAQYIRLHPADAAARSLYDNGSHVLKTSATSQGDAELWARETVDAATSAYRLKNKSTQNYMVGASAQAADGTTSSTATTVYLPDAGNSTVNILATQNGTYSLNMWGGSDTNGDVKGYDKTDGGSKWTIEPYDPSAAALDGHFIRLFSRKNGKALGLATDGKLTLVDYNATDLGQQWVIFPMGGGYNLRSAKTGMYIQSVNADNVKFSTGASGATFYLSRHTVEDGQYIALSFEASATGHGALHVDGGDAVVRWEASNDNSQWYVEAASLTKADMKALFARVDGAVTPTAGKVYRIKNRYYGDCLTENFNTHGLTGEGRNVENKAQLWKLAKTDDCWTLQNVYTQQYIQRRASNDNQYVTGTASAKDKAGFWVQDITYYEFLNVYNILDMGNRGLHHAAGGSVVDWGGSDGTGNAGSEWVFEEVEMTEAELTAAHQQYTDLVSLRQNIGTYATQLRTFFADEACTTLKDTYQAMTDDALRTAMAALPTALQDMAVKVKNGSWAEWEETFRVHSYRPYSDPVYHCDHWALEYYDRINNPTGIVASTNESLFVIVDGDVPDGATLQAELIQGTGWWAQTSVALHKGLNLITSTLDNSALFINYVSANNSYNGNTISHPLSEYPDMKIHVEGGRVNGFFDINARTNADWAAMNAAGLFTAPVIDVMGRYAHLHVDASTYKSILGTTANAHVTDAVAVLDSVVLWEVDLMGLTRNDQYPDIYHDVYPRVFNNHMLVMSSSDGFLDASNYRVHAGGWAGINEICNWQKMNAGQVWGMAHETGHLNQPLINLAGCTEVSNNLFSQVCNYRAGKICSRYHCINDLKQDIAQYQASHGRMISWPELANHDGDIIGCINRMYFNLYLYYHVMGHKPTFWPEMFNKFRASRMVHPTSPNLTYAKNDYLKFARFASEVAGEDLSPYFEAWGFFVPIPVDSPISLSDYSTWKMVNPQADIDAARTAMEACGPKNSQLLFIDDRVEQPLKADGTPKADFDSWNSVATTATMNTMGGMSKFAAQTETSGNSLTLSADGKVTLSDAAAASSVGVMVYDADGKLAYISATPTFTLPEVLKAKQSELKFVASAASGEDLPLLDATASTTIALDVYRGTPTPVVRYTDGTNGLPTLAAGEIAWVKTEGASLTGDNVVGTDATASRLVLTDKSDFYTPQAFTAQEVTYGRTPVAGYNSLCLPFATEAADFGSGCTLETLSGQTQDAIIFQTTAAAEAGQPVLVHCPDATPWTLTKHDATIAASPVATQVGTLSLNGSFRRATIGAGRYKLNTSGTSFGTTQSDEATVAPFRVYLSATSPLKQGIRVLHTTPTGITQSTIKNNAAMYDLSGRRLTTEPQHGIVIRGGKKIIR